MRLIVIAEAVAAGSVADPLVSGFEYAGCWPLPAPQGIEGAAIS